jgi:hypothetical protein
LVVSLSIVFTVLSVVTTHGVRDVRDTVWIATSLISVGVYGFAVVRRGLPFFVSLAKLQIIFLISELIGFGIYVVKSKAIQYRDSAAWLYFYPYLIVTAFVVLITFPLCFAFFKRLGASHSRNAPSL